MQKDGPAPRHLYRRVLAVVAPYALGTFFVLSVGTAAYWIHTNGSEDHQGDKNVRVRKDVLEWRSQLLGWISAVLYCEWLFHEGVHIYILLILLYKWAHEYHK